MESPLQQNQADSYLQTAVPGSLPSKISIAVSPLCAREEKSGITTWPSASAQPGQAACTWAACQLAQGSNAPTPSAACEEVPAAPAVCGAGPGSQLLSLIANPPTLLCACRMPSLDLRACSQDGFFVYPSPTGFGLHAQCFINIKLSFLGAISSTLLKFLLLAC